MSRTRTAQGFPLALASLCGFVVATVSGLTGIVAHWLASAAPMPVTVDALAATGAVCAGVGILTAAGATRFHPALVVPAGLVSAQGSVHYALEWSHRLHAHGPAGSDFSGHAAHMMHNRAEQASMAREAMTVGASTVGHGSFTSSMLATHAVATVVTAVALALVAGLLGWLTARAEQVTIAQTTCLDRPRISPRPSAPRAVTSTFLLSRGLLRGPPSARAAPVPHARA